MRIWIGKYIAVVGVLHCALGVVVFSGTFADLFRDGFFNTINGEPELEFPFWFVVVGVFWVVLGVLIDSVEKAGQAIPRFVGWAVFGSAVVGAAIMPLSGWWLFLIPGVALVRKKVQGSKLNVEQL